jgi:hypothetical protein
VVVVSPRGDDVATRLNINVSDQTAKLLRELADRNETSVTEVVRRAVSVYKYFEDADLEGKEVKLVGADASETIRMIR